MFSWSSDKMLAFWTRMNDPEERRGAALLLFLNAEGAGLLTLGIFEKYNALTSLRMLKKSPGLLKIQT
jgi:hypothetical protein